MKYMLIVCTKVNIYAKFAKNKGYFTNFSDNPLTLLQPPVIIYRYTIQQFETDLTQI